MKFTNFTCLMMFGLTAACGGGEETSFFRFAASEPTGFDRLVDVSEAYDDRFSGVGAADHRVSVGAEVPQTGSASFSGYMTIGPSRFTPSIIDSFIGGAETTLSVDFDTGIVAGESGQFYDISDPLNLLTVSTYGDAIDGSVRYELTALASAENTFVGAATGEMVTGDGERIIIDDVVSGAVMGPDAEAFRVVSIDDLAPDIQVYYAARLTGLNAIAGMIARNA